MTPSNRQPSHEDSVHPNWTRFSAVSLALIALDQVTKIWVRAAFPIDQYGRALSPDGSRLARPHKVEVIPGLFDLVHVENKGAAWGILANHEYRIPFFALVTGIAMTAILFYYRQLRDDEALVGWSLTSIFAGAMGNFIDRMLFHKVTDFLDFYASGAAAPYVAKVLGSAHWPAFNVADSCITVGVTILAVHALILEPRMRKRLQAGTGTGSAEPPSEGPVEGLDEGLDEPTASSETQQDGV